MLRMKKPSAYGRFFHTGGPHRAELTFFKSRTKVGIQEIIMTKRKSKMARSQKLRPFRIRGDRRGPDELDVIHDIVYDIIEYERVEIRDSHRKSVRGIVPNLVDQMQRDKENDNPNPTMDIAYIEVLMRRHPQAVATYKAKMRAAYDNIMRVQLNLMSRFEREERKANKHRG